MPDPRLSWFFAFNDNSPAVYELVKGAVLSSQPFPMDRYCVCDTNNEGVVAFLESHGVRVIRTRVSFDEALRESDVATPPAEKSDLAGDRAQGSTSLRL